ncbi:iron dependent repressor, metal binding and dimerization domain protein [Clostridium sp. UBA1056]|uniref:metal-dependent transcriptional regulator n=1 Tax=unclassified Clostridium TaxID=2614128 RepID=UPI0032166159
MDKNFYTVRAYEQKLFDDRLLTASMEDYVEMLYRCTMKEENYIRLNKLALMLNVRDSSASKMMQKLGKLGLVDYEKYGIIKLTDLGTKVGRYLLSRHNTIEKFLRFLSADSDILVETELIEHVVSSTTVENLNILNNFIESNENILAEYRAFREEYYKKVKV